jgi:diaminopimelate epimerase
MPTLEFTKMHGCGNDYIYVIMGQERLIAPATLARRLSDRRFGIGADGLILLLPSDTADLRMEIYNADGSRAEMCGNGIRCAARLAFERDLVSKNPLRIETDAGLRTVTLKFDRDGRVEGATVDMGAPVLNGPEIPVKANGRVIIDYPIEIDGIATKITALSMGNPHAVVFVEDERVFVLPDSEFASLGRKFEHHPFFPRGVNTEFVLPLGADRLKMRVWERGSGETLACGTGACAALVAGVLTGRTGQRATVVLRGGELEIEWRQALRPDGRVFMTGEAVEVFRGSIELDERELAASE